MGTIRMRTVTILGFGVLGLVFAGRLPAAPSPPPPTLTLVCNWGVGPACKAAGPRAQGLA